jgi:hypothetical protein
MDYSKKHWLANLAARGMSAMPQSTVVALFMGCFFGRSAMVLDARYAEMRPDASEGCTVRRWLGLKRGSRVAQGKARQGKQ